MGHPTDLPLLGDGAASAGRRLCRQRTGVPYARVQARHHTIHDHPKGCREGGGIDYRAACHRVGYVDCGNSIAAARFCSPVLAP
jgi:hypothetical protein